MEEKEFLEKYPDIQCDSHDEYCTMAGGYSRFVLSYYINKYVEVVITGRDVEECHETFDKIMSKIKEIDFTECIRYQTLYEKCEDEIIQWQNENEKEGDEVK